jgi:hypothetical protein
MNMKRRRRGEGGHREDVRVESSSDTRGRGIGTVAVGPTGEVSRHAHAEPIIGRVKKSEPQNKHPTDFEKRVTWAHH